MEACSSSENPADILSRGALPENIINSQFWFHGPSFLQDPTLDLSAINHFFENLTLPEEKKTVGVVTSLNNETLTNTLFSRFSSWPRLKRTTSWCFRFAFNLKAPCKRSGAHSRRTSLFDFFHCQNSAT